MLLEALLLSVLCVAPPAGAGDEHWGSLEQGRPAARKMGRPSARLFDAALDDMQRALTQWERERRELGRELEAADRIRQLRSAESREVPEDGLPVDPERGGTAASRVKIIEVPRERDGGGQQEKEPEEEPSVEGDAPVEQEMRRLDEELRERQRLCDENPERCAKEKAQRRLIREGNRAWDEAVDRKERAREEAIEAQARKIQAELDAARRREAQERARKMGGAIDAQGNFVDEELHRAIDEEKDAQ